MWSALRHGFPRPDHKYYNFFGQAKGMKAMVEEQGLWGYLCAQNGSKALFGDCAKSQNACNALSQSTAAQSLWLWQGWKPPEDNQILDQSSTCCMCKVLFLQGNFWAEIPQVQKIIQEPGHEHFSLPKFHCELNPIEMYWGRVKIYKLHALPTCMTTFW